MRFVEAVKIALSSLRAHKLRSFLTLLGVIFGVMTVVAVASVIEGFFGYISSRATADLGVNTVVLDKFGIITSFEEFLEANKRNKDLKLDDLEYLKERMATGQYFGAQDEARTEVRSQKDYMSDLIVRGITGGMADIDTTTAEYGRYLNENDDNNHRDKAFIGSVVAEKLFNKRDAVGEEIKIDGRPFEVVGVAKEQGSFFGNPLDEFVAIPYSVYQKLWGTRGSISISVKGYEGTKPAVVQDEIRSLMRIRNKLRYNDKDNFGFVTADAINDFVQGLFGMVAAVALGVVSISLVVGGIVIMNIMLVSVTERTREIGIRKSLGARHKDILMQFLVESTTLSIIGGITGLALAYAISIGLVNFTSVPAQLPYWAAVLAIGVSSSVGLIFGIYPAWKAAKLDPIVALRSE